MNPVQNMFLYIRTYIDENGVLYHYIGMTNDLLRRKKEHDNNKCDTTKKMNKKYIYYKTHYEMFLGENCTEECRKEEKRMKKLNERSIERKVEKMEVWTE